MRGPETTQSSSDVSSEGAQLDTIPGYRLNEIRTPAKPLVQVVPTPSQTSGPFFPPALVQAGENNLAFEPSRSKRALGTLVSIRGRLLGEDGGVLRYSLIEIWQANKFGKYRHPVEDKHDAPHDDNFRGFGRCLTDDDGFYHFITIKPGPYPVPGYSDWCRPPHIHFSVFGAGVMQRLITQMYFAGEALNDVDKILNAVKDQEVRNRLVVAPSGSTIVNGEPCDEYSFDIVLRGSAETPFFDD